MHLQRVVAQVAGGGHDIPEDKIRYRHDASRANLIELMPHPQALHVYDNSAPADAKGQVCPLLVLEMDQAGVRYPVIAEEFAQLPNWVKAIVDGAGSDDAAAAFSGMRSIANSRDVFVANLPLKHSVARSSSPGR